MSKFIIKYDWLIITGLFLVVELILNPLGEFALNDDWAYSKAIYNYINSGELWFSNWQGFPDLPRFFISTWLCKIFGFSHTLLRISTITYFLLSIYAFNRILTTVKPKPSIRFFSLLLFTFNPLSLNLCNTYMSDVFQLLLTLISLFIVIKLFEEPIALRFILLIIITTVATLNRQISLFFPLAFAILYIYQQPKSYTNLFIAGLPFAVNLLFLILYHNWATNNQILPGSYSLQSDNIIYSILHPSLNAFYKIGYYFVVSTVSLGLFIFPLSFANLKEHFHAIKMRKKNYWILGIYLFLLLFIIVNIHNPQPYVGNIFYHLAVGPVILTGYNTDDSFAISHLARLFNILLIILGGFSFITFLINLLNSMIRQKNKSAFLSGALFLLVLALYLIPLCFNYANDRYLLIILPFLFLAYVLTNTNKVWPVSFGLIYIPIFYFSISANYNYLNLNKARAKAAVHLLQDLKVSPTKIDGGFEFNGWHLSEYGKNYIPSHKGRWWWVEKDDYVISAVQLTNYTVESEYDFKTWPPYAADKIYVLKKITEN